MNRRRTIAFATLALVSAGALLLLARPHGDSGGEAMPVAPITVAKIRAAKVVDSVKAYGVVAVDANGSTTVAAPRALVIERLDVSLGQAVTAGQPLIEAASAPPAGLAWRQAQDALKQARADAARTQRLYAEKLVASDQLAAAQKALADARAAVAAQAAQGGPGVQALRAPAAGVITSLGVAAGDHVAQDAPLATLARAGALGAQLGLEPSVGRFAVGQPVSVRPAMGGPVIASHLSRVADMADPATRMLDAFAPLPAGGPPVGSALSAEVVTGAHQGLIVPRGAVVFDETGAHVFLVSGGHARRVFVTAGADQGDDIEISGPIAAGEEVAVQGAYELEDGMAVRVDGR